MFLQPVQDHSEAGSDACPAVTGPVLCQPEHRRLQVVGLQPCPAVSQAGLDVLGGHDGGPLPVAEVAGSDHLSPGEGQPPLDLLGGAARASRRHQVHAEPADVAARCLWREVGHSGPAEVFLLGRPPPGEAEAGDVVSTAVFSSWLPEVNCRAGGGDLWRGPDPAVVQHQTADPVGRQRRQRGVVAAPGRHDPVQRHEARAVGGLSPQLGRCLWADAARLLPRHRRRGPAEGAAKLQHYVEVRRPPLTDGQVLQPLRTAAGPVDGEEPQRLGRLAVVTLDGGGGGGLAVLQGQQQGLPLQPGDRVPQFIDGDVGLPVGRVVIPDVICLQDDVRDQVAGRPTPVHQTLQASLQ